MHELPPEHHERLRPMFQCFEHRLHGLVEAVCTPDFFGYNARLELQYRGRLDASGRQAAAPDTRRELLEAMREVAATGRGPAQQTASIGCSIKWR